MLYWFQDVFPPNIKNAASIFFEKKNLPVNLWTFCVICTLIGQCMLNLPLYFSLKPFQGKKDDGVNNLPHLRSLHPQQLILLITADDVL